MPTAANTTKRRNTRAGRDLLGDADWVNAAVRAMLQGSVADVKVERLARELRVTRGSFYWHFKDRGALLTAVLRHWEEMTARFNLVLARHDPDPRQRLLRLLLLPEDKSADIPPGEFESAIRAWARRSPQVRKVTGRVDRLRMQTITQLVSDLGASAERASVLAAILSAITAMLWQRQQMSPEIRHEVITEFYAMLLAAVTPAQRVKD